MHQYTEIEKLLGVDYTDEELEALKVQAAADHELLENPVLETLFRKSLDSTVKLALERGTLVPKPKED